MMPLSCGLILNNKKPAHTVKRAQKESLLLRELSQWLMQIAMDEPALRDLFISRVRLSTDKGLCNIYFYTAQGLDHFRALMPTLILYKPSLRTALAKSIPSRYTPELTFKFDEEFEKQQHLDALLDKIKATE
jgi:ribosome-binding factor A